MESAVREMNSKRSPNLKFRMKGEVLEFFDSNTDMDQFGLCEFLFAGGESEGREVADEIELFFGVKIEPCTNGNRTKNALLDYVLVG